MTKAKDAAIDAAIANANLNTWGAVVALLEGGLLSGPSNHHDTATSRVIKIANDQMQKEFSRYELALKRVERDHGIGGEK